MSQLSRLHIERNHIQTLQGEGQPSKELLTQGEVAARSVAAIRSVPGRDTIVSKPNEYRSKVIKWGVENNEDDLDRYFANTEIVLTHATSHIDNDDSEYIVGAEYGDAFLGLVGIRRARGPSPMRKRGGLLATKRTRPAKTEVAKRIPGDFRGGDPNEDANEHKVQKKSHRRSKGYLAIISQTPWGVMGNR